MSDKPKYDDRTAFPHAIVYYGCEDLEPAPHQGMTLRQHAAIELRVPDSGVDWLDEMIRKARRMDLAGQIPSLPVGTSGEDLSFKAILEFCGKVNDAMLEASDAT